jgi:Protein of unknown function (DUF2971)
MKDLDKKLALYLNITSRIQNYKKNEIDYIYNDENQKIGYRNFYNNVEDNDVSFLWRYSDLKGFLTFITSNELYFNRIDKFEDGREGENLYFTKIREELSKKGKTDMEHLEFMKNHENLFQQTCYVNCWRNDDKESPMMWGLYAKNTEGVALKISHRDFLEFTKSLYFKLPIQEVNKRLRMPISNSSKNKALKESYFLFLENVRYKDFDELLQSDSITVYNNYIFGLMKDKIFTHEQEVRLVIRDNDISVIQSEGSNDTKNIHGISLPYDKKLLKFFTLVFHPKVEPWYCLMIKNLLKELNIPIQCEESSLKYR